MTPSDVRRCIARGSGGCGHDRVDRAAPEADCWLLYRRSFGTQARRCWRCTSLAPPVSMALRSTETSGRMRSIELLGEWMTLRAVAATERRPLGSADEDVRGAARAICSTRLPVPPGCDIRLACVTMQVNVPDFAAGGTRKSIIHFARFSERLGPCLLPTTAPACAWPLSRPSACGLGDYNVVTYHFRNDATV
jgi:hypothetical protein